jgi:peptide deformylase
MPLLKILLFPDPRLRTVATAVTKINEEILSLTKAMLTAMYEGNGIGLAATQVNVHKRVIVIDVSEEKDNPLILINPQVSIINNEDKISSEEGCLSVPGFYEEVERPNKVEITYQNLKGEKIDIIPSGLQSVVIQHEIDHLNGKVFVDYLSSVKRDMIKKKLLKGKTKKYK